ncbi:MAG: class II glutamine amidotransferase [Pseudomonadota bacterium]
MCRWAAYVGAPIFLSEVVTAPKQSLIAQSLRAHEAVTEVNADGFGMAWYDAQPEPGLYRDVMPAWSDDNLKSLARQVQSRLFLAHVRASTETATSRNNCHPFAVGRWSFMHNGQIGGFGRFRRSADMIIPEELYDNRKGATDSEALFLMALSEGLETEPQAAMERATGMLERMSRSAGATPHVRMTAALSDGERIYAVRYASDDAPPSLYHHERAGGRLVVSEPLDKSSGDWQAIPPSSWVEISTDGVEIRPFRPEI